MPASEAHRYYYVRARRGGGETGPGEPIAYSSSVWVTATCAGSCAARRELRRGRRVIARATVAGASVRTLRLPRAALRRVSVGARFEVRLLVGGRIVERRAVVVRR